MTSVKTKVNYALSETRTLILGAQILLGFQFSAVFHPGFDRLAAPGRWLDMAALGCMVITVTLLMAPGPFHRLAESEMADERLHRFTTRVAETALLPFGVAIALDVFIVAERVLSGPASGLLGAAVAGFAGLSWYGAEMVQRERRGAGSGQGERKDQGSDSLQERIQTLLTETRVVLPGAQAMLGFQFVAFLSDAFDRLPESSKLLHFASLAAMALAMILLMAPAAYHRVAARGEEREDVDRFGSAVMLAALVPLALGLAGDVAVVMRQVAQAASAEIAAGAATFAVFLGFWFGMPLLSRALRARGGYGGSDAARSGSG